MGFSKYNNVDNLLKDCQSGAIDVFGHMGDHAYDLGMENDRKGDAYMNALQPLFATCPWIPIIGAILEFVSIVLRLFPTVLRLILV